MASFDNDPACELLDLTPPLRVIFCPIQLFGMVPAPYSASGVAGTSSRIILKHRWSHCYYLKKYCRERHPGQAQNYEIKCFENALQLLERNSWEQDCAQAL